MNDQLAAMKQGAKATWALGNFDEVSKQILSAGLDVITATAVGEGDEVLDVACGTGNAAIPAAERGATVTGLDITPELLEDARRNAADAGVEATFVEGDAEDLPFEDGSFDVVVSTFGCMFAPRHEAAAAEIARVLRPGGRIGIAAWTPEGRIGEFFKMMGSHVPPPPAGVATGPPILWGSPDHVTQLFAGSGIDLEFTRNFTEARYEDLGEGLEYFAERFGPLVMARKALEPQGKWQAVMDDMRANWEAANEATDGSVYIRNEYLRTTGTKAG
jgi:SAM-dependent methyltransferase